MSDDPHAETIDYRINRLGWTEKEAREMPVRFHPGRNGKPNVAQIAREFEATPSKVQLYMRQGYSLDDAILMAWEAEEKA